jgi:hypothetical protein
MRPGRGVADADAQALQRAPAPWGMSRAPRVSHTQACTARQRARERARALASPASPRPGGPPLPARGLRAPGAGDAGRLPAPAFSLFSPRRARGPSAGGAGGASAARALASAASSSACTGPHTLGLRTPSSSACVQPSALGDRTPYSSACAERQTLGFALPSSSARARVALGRGVRLPLKTRVAKSSMHLGSAASSLSRPRARAAR